MFRDKSLVPTEAIRLAALGMLAERPWRYADLARAVRQFTSRVTGPSLDLLGPSLELLRYEGLIAPISGEGIADNAELRLTDEGRAVFARLMLSPLRVPLNDIGKLVAVLKVRFLDQLDADSRHDLLDSLIALHEGEIARLEDLRRGAPDADLFIQWVSQDLDLARTRLTWLHGLQAG